MHLSLTKRITVFVLLAALLLPLAACGKTENPPAKDPAGTSSVPDTVAEETEPVITRDPPNVGKMDFDGAAFTTLVHKNYTNKYFRDEEIGEVFNDAVYSRNRKTEEYLNIVWTYAEGSYSKLNASVEADDNAYQHLISHDLTNNDKFVQSGLLYRAENLPYIDYDADWWDWDNMELLRLGKYHYYLVSDYLLSMPYAIFVNFDLINNYHLEDPYEIVKNGTWTLDKFAEMCEAAAHDADGDGAWGDADTVGVYAVDPSCYSSIVTGCDQAFTSRDESGTLVIAMTTEKMQNIVEKMTALAKTPGALMSWETKRNFSDGRTLFFISAIGTLKAASDYDFETGILPFPKYDESQDIYRTLNWGAIMAVPLSIKDPALSGAVMEYTAWESGNEVIPAYYDISLGTRYSKDPATRDMLGLVLKNLYYDAGMTHFGMSGMLDHLYIIGYLCILSQSTDLQSWLKKKQTAFDWSMEQMLEGLELAEED